MRIITIYFVRHGHAAHNAAAEIYGDYAYHDKLYTDAHLTEKGVLQATNLQYFFKKNNPDIVFSSPLKRCLQTLDHALVDFDNYIHVDDRLIERLGEHPCNLRSEKHHVTKHIKRKLKVDHVKDEVHWPNKRETNDEIVKRIHEWFENLVEHLKENININKVAVFSHYEFLYTLFNHSSLPFCNNENNHPFDNCDVREVKFII